MGKIVSQLLAEALVKQKSSAKSLGFKWISRPMRSHVDLIDKDEVYRILGRDFNRAMPLTLMCCSMPADSDFKKFEFLEISNPFS